MNKYAIIIDVEDFVEKEYLVKYKELEIRGFNLFLKDVKDITSEICNIDLEVFCPRSYLPAPYFFEAEDDDSARLMYKIKRL